MRMRDVQWGPLAQVSTKPHPALSQTLITSERQRQAVGRLQARNTQRAEAWRYTSLKKLSSLQLSEDRHQSVWCGQLNGTPIDAVCAKGVRIYHLSELASRKLDAFEEKAWAWVQDHMNSKESICDLQSLHYQDGLLVLVDPECDAGTLKIEHTIRNHTKDLKVSASNLWVYLATNASLQLVESFSVCQGEGINGQHVMIPLSTLQLCKGSSLNYTRSQETSRNTRASDFHIGRVTASVEAEAKLILTSLNLGSDLCRLEMDVSLVESGAYAELNGLYLGSDKALLDQHLTLRHRAANCISIQKFKGALGGRSKGIFTGRIIVAPGCSNTRADQNNPNLLLSNSAKAITRPQLEIYNDDVECSHGATVGQLDEDALFYLKTRGLDESEALRALTSAFVGEIRESLIDNSLKKSIDRALKKSLGIASQTNEESEEWIDWETLKI